MKEKLSESEKKELHDLCDALVDERITPADHRKLDQWIIRSPAAAAFYLEHIKLCAALHIFAGTIEAEEKQSIACQTEKNASPQNRKLLPIWQIVAAFALLLLGASAVGYWLNQPRPDKDPIARLEFVSPDALFRSDHQLPRTTGKSLTKGWIHLERGELQVRFRSGARVELQGPAAFGIDSPMRSYLDYGRIEVHAPESARDFVVATESMEVVDLGTRFELEVDQETRESVVSVSEGLVDLHLGTPGTQRRIQPLEAGFSAQVDAVGDILTVQKTQVEKPVVPRLVAHWKLDDVPAEAEQVQSISGIAGRAAHLGERGYIDVSDWAEKLGQTESFTIAAWVRNPSDRTAILFSLSDGTLADRVQLHLSRRHLVFGWQHGAHYDAVSGRTGEWEPDRWYHVAVTVRRGMVRLYRDGEQIGSSPVGQRIGTPVPTLSSVKHPTHAFLGTLSALPQFFGGAIDDVQLYAKAVQGKNIRYLYEHPGECWDPRPGN